MGARHSNHAGESGSTCSSPSCATPDHIDSLRTVFDQRGHAGPSALFGGIERSTACRHFRRPTLLERSLLIGNWWGADRLTCQLRKACLQSAETTLYRAIPLLEKEQCELGHVVGKLGHTGFQVGELLKQVCFWWAGGRQGLSEWQVFRLIFRRGWSLPRGGNGTNCGRKLQGTPMQVRHLLDVFPLHTADACIRRMSSQGHMGLLEPIVQGLGMNPKPGVRHQQQEE